MLDGHLYAMMIKFSVLIGTNEEGKGDDVWIVEQFLDCSDSSIGNDNGDEDGEGDDKGKKNLDCGEGGAGTSNANGDDCCGSASVRSKPHTDPGVHG